MRSLWLSFVAVETLAVCAFAPAFASTELQSAHVFALGGVGDAGTMSPGEKAVRAILSQPDAAQKLEAMFPDATDAGRLYILIGLRMRDRAAYARVFAACSKHDSVVDTMRGCIVLRESFRKLVHEIDRGGFDVLIKQPPW